jgi:group I intron endonuclease
MYYLQALKLKILMVFHLIIYLILIKLANSLLGYKHTPKAIKKMETRFLNKENHPMFGKSHSEDAKKLISTPGILNPMYNKTDSINTKQLISLKLSKRPLGLYSLDMVLIKTFISQVEAAKFFNVYKGTIGRYVKSGNIFKGKYYFKEIN